jgi:hypothetical protein
MQSQIDESDNLLTYDILNDMQVLRCRIAHAIPLIDSTIVYFRQLHHYYIVAIKPRTTAMAVVIVETNAIDDAELTFSS